MRNMRMTIAFGSLLYKMNRTKTALTLMELIIKYNEHQMVLLKHLPLAWKL